MKYLHLYSSVDEVITKGSESTPFVGEVNGENKVIYASVSKYGDTVKLISDGEGYFKPSSGSTDPVPSSNEIYYTTTDGNVFSFFSPELAGLESYTPAIVTNTYENGFGIVTFDGTVTTMGLEIDDAGEAIVALHPLFMQLDSEGSTTVSLLKTVTLPDTITIIGMNTFNEARNLSDITLPPNLTEIGMSAFGDCRSLTSITIPESVTTIGVSAFEECYGISEINYKGTTSQWSNITKGEYWNKDIPTTTVVNCSNGTCAMDS